MQAVLQASDVSPAVRRRWIARVKNAQRRIGRLEEKSAAEVRAVLRRAKANILGAINAATGDFDQWFLPQTLRALEDAVAEYQRELAATVLEKTQDAAALGFGRTGEAARALGIDIPGVPVAIPRDVLEMATQLVPEFVQAESQVVLQGIAREMRLAFAGGQTKAQLVQRVQGKLTKTLRFAGKRHRAETIVRTEVNRIHNAAHVEGMKKAENVKVMKRWVSAGDGRTRPEHRMLNGTMVDADEPFPYPGLPRSMWPMYPLDPVLPAEASINCRCTVVEVFEVLDEEDVEEVVA